MIAGVCSKCGCEIELLKGEVRLLKEGVGDMIVVNCPGCGQTLAVKNPFKKPAKD